MKTRVTILLLAIAALTIPTTFAQTLVKDIWVGGESSAPKEFAWMDGQMYFAGDNEGMGIELWKTDGTAMGTVLVADINPLEDSDPSWLAAGNGLLFFRANDGTSGDEVWVTDGTAAGTRLTRDIHPGADGSHPEHIGVMDGIAYFMADDGTNGSELWRSDGTPEGTFMVMDINPGAGSSSPHWHTVLGAWVYFRADDGQHGDELWRTDGTTTELVKDINPGIEGSSPERFVVMGDRIYFPANTAAFGAELWTSDGTEAGTFMVKDVNTAGDGAPKHVTVVGDQVFFAAENGLQGAELWASDGTMAGTRLVKDIWVGDAPSLPTNLVAAGSRLFFSANDGTQEGTALWKSDGTEEGTVKVKDVRADGEPAFMYFTGLTGSDKLLFTANDGAAGVELWQSDGTPGGTFMVMDISSGAASSAPLSLTDGGGTLFFSASDQVNGRELWVYDPETPPDTPVARADVASTQYETAVRIDVLANDSGASLDIIEVADPAHGTASIGMGQAQDIVYTPDAGFSGTDSFVYTIEDADGEQVFAQVLVTVLAFNSPPSISSIADQTTAEDTPPEEIHFTIGDAESPANTLIVTASSDNQSLIPDANIAVEGGSANRGLAIMPAPDQTGQATISVTVSDGSLSTSTSFVLTVTPVNDAPGISGVDNVETAEDTPVGPLAFTVSDMDTDVDLLTTSATSDNQRLLPDGNILLGGSGSDRTVLLTPAANQAGLATVTLYVSDGELTTSTSFLLTVSAVDAPVISAIADQVTAQDTPLGPVAFTITDTVTPASELMVSASSSNQTVLPDGGIELAGAAEDRSITMTPAPGVWGQSTVTLTVEDGDGYVNSVAFVLTVSAENTPPSATEDSYRVADDVVLIVSAEEGVLANDTDVDGDALTAQLVAPPEHGALSFNPDGSFSYVQDPNVGESTIVFTYQAFDGTFTSAITTVSILIGENMPPTISAIDDQTADEGDVVEITGIQVKDDMSHGEGLTVTAVSDNQALLPDENIAFHGGGDMRVMKMTLVKYASGTVGVTVTVRDEDGLSASTSFTITVRAVNDAPTISEIADVTTAEDVAVGPITFLVADVETASADLIVTAVSDNQGVIPDAAITLGGSTAERTITLTPAPNAAGTALVTVTVSDGELSASETFMVTVTAVDAPTISTISDQETLENTPVGPVSFTVSDAVTAAENLAVTAVSSNQTLLPDANIDLGGLGTDRTITLTPAADAFGSAQVTITVEDEDGHTASETFNLTVGAANQPPVAVDDIYTAAEGETLVVDAASGVLANDSDPNGDALTAILVDPPATGTLTLNPDGSFTYVPVDEHSHDALPSETDLLPQADLGVLSSSPPEGGEEEEPLTFTYQAFDGSLTSETATVTLALEHAAAISQIPDQMAKSGETIGPLSFTVRPGHASLIANSSNQALVPNTSITLGGEGRQRTVTLQTTAGEMGLATITIATASGGDQMQFDLEVQSINAPDITSVADRTVHAGSGPYVVPFTVADADTDLNALHIQAESDNPTLLPPVGIVIEGSDASRTATLYTVSGETGSANVTITVSDGLESSATTFRVTVVAAGTPVAVDDVYELVDLEVLVINAENGVLANDWDPDGDPLTAELVAPPAAGELVLEADGSFRYTPSVEHVEELLFTYVASDGVLQSDVATVLLSAPHTDELGISAIADQETGVGVPVGPIAFTVTPGKVSVSATSSNENLLPVSGILLEGTMGRNRSVTLNPEPNRHGFSDVTLIVTDGSETAQTTFRLRVTTGRRTGDANADESVNVADAVTMLRYIVQIDAEISVAADVTGEGSVNVSDVVTLLRYIVRSIDCFPVDEACVAEQPAVAAKNSSESRSPILDDAEAHEVIIPLVAGSTTGFELDLTFDASHVAVASMDLDLPEQWMVMRNDQDGRVMMAAVGLEPVESGEFGRLILKVTGEGIHSIKGTLQTAEGAMRPIEAVSDDPLPTSYRLEGNYPNPFNPSTTIRYALPATVDVRIDVYNVLGQKVTTLFSGRQTAGVHDVTVAAGDWPTGVYIYQVVTEDKVMTGTMMLVK